MHNFSNLFDKVLYMLHVHCPSSEVYQHCIHAMGICHASYVDCLLARSGSILTSLADSQHNKRDKYLLLCIQCWDTPDDGQ